MQSTEAQKKWKRNNYLSEKSNYQKRDKSIPSVDEIIAGLDNDSDNTSYSDDDKESIYETIDVLAENNYKKSENIFLGKSPCIQTSIKKREI